jgi:competence protein ComFC
LHQYKFESRKGLAHFFAQNIQLVLNERFAGIPVVPVPVTPAKRRKRGWGHIECITNILERRYKIPVLYLLQKKNTREQKELDFRSRNENLEGKILFNNNIGSTPKQIVLLDDVFTTGATANECARILISSKIEDIFVLTLALD